MKSKIILTADDYGANNFIDKAVISAIKDGLINSVATFVTFKDSEERVRTLLELQRQEAQKGNLFGIGLHFSLTAGYPVIKEKNTLTYPHTEDIIFREANNYPFERVNEQEIRKELAAQINLLGQWMGSIDKIDHVSNHHGVTYIDSSIFMAYADEIKQNFGIPIRSPLNWSKSGLKFLDYDILPSIPLGRQGIKLRWADQLFETLEANIHKRIKYASDNGLVFPFCFSDSVYGQPLVGNLDFLMGQMRSQVLLESPTKTVEMMFHLGYYEGHPDNHYPDENIETDGIDQGYYYKRKLELQALRRCNWKVIFEEMEIDKITYRGLQS
jgi:predicted glycoside hydrolase/deacetylase ChbG (UPF0249 family)